MKIRRGFPVQHSCHNVLEIIQTKVVFMAEYQHGIKDCKLNESNRACFMQRVARWSVYTRRLLCLPIQSANVLRHMIDSCKMVV